MASLDDFSNDNETFTAGRKAAITLYSDPMGVDSHRVRILMEEKDIVATMVNVESKNPPEELLQINPYGSVPTLIDRDLMVHDGSIIMEYLDERYPHPPMMPIDAVSRARVRLFMRQVVSEWYPLVKQIRYEDDAALRLECQKTLRDRIVQLKPAFAHQPYFMNDDYSLLDMTIAPVLWRLPYLEIELPKHAKPIRDYMDKVFARPAFQRSLTEQEEVMGA